jgi:peptidoglycan/LPS O-acetylase OafA/YrhL
MKRQRLEYLDGLRGLAATVVVVGHCLGQAADKTNLDGMPLNFLHCYFMLHSFTVPLFICLSGFVLGIPVVIDQELRGGIWQYTKRRARRILPPYYFAFVLSIAVALSIGELGLRDMYDVAYQIVAPAMLMHDIWGNTNAYNVPLWSLAVEWHAYALLPAFLVAWKAWGLTASFAGAFFFAILGTYFYPSSYIQYHAIFFIGVLASSICLSPNVWLVQLRSLFPWRTALFVACVLFAVFLDLYGWSNYSKDHSVFDVGWGILSGVLILCLTFGYFSRLRELLEGRLFEWLGQRSYSIYLLHWPIVLIAQSILVKAGARSFGSFALGMWALVLPATLSSASFSWYFFERWSQRRVPQPALLQKLS